MHHAWWKTLPMVMGTNCHTTLAPTQLHKTKERKLPLAFFDQAASTQAARTPQMYSTVHDEALLSLMLMMHSRWPKGTTCIVTKRLHSKANTQEKLTKQLHRACMSPSPKKKKLGGNNCHWLLIADHHKLTQVTLLLIAKLSVLVVA
jgi:hypothetical protein